MRHAGRIIICLVALVAFATSALAQIATTSLRGVIHDPSGAVVSGATVKLLNTGTSQTFTTTADASGEYLFPQIPPASYTITVSATGFGNQTKEATLLVNQPATIDFTLTVQASKTVVNVSASAQTLNTTDATLGNSMGNSEIQALPSLTRNVPDLLALQPGVLYIPLQGNNITNQDSRTGAVNGGRADQGNITLDGIDDNDQVNGYAFQGVLRETQDAIQEFRVVTSNANADAGRSSGAQVSMITKSGTNRFHGALYEYHRPTFTVANDWFNKQAQLASGLPNIPGKLIRNIFGGDLGGPIKKDKLFFFGNYEGQRQAENAQVSQTDPTASYQKGNLIYQGDTNGGQVVNVTLTPAQVTALDATAGCDVCNTPAYPAGPGPNPYALAYFNQQPAANGTFLGDGLNTGSYSFSSPNPVTLNTSIGRIDWAPSDRQHVFVRGGLQKDTRGDVEQYPGQGPSNVHEDNTKGLIAGWTWTISPTLVNDLRYGYIRQGFSDRGVGHGDYVVFRFQSDTTAHTRTTIVSNPINNIVDNFNWSKGNHNIQLGVNWRLVHQNYSSDVTTFNDGTSNPYWLGGSAPDPGTIGQFPVDSGFGNSYLIAYANLIGTVPEVDDSINYKVSSPTTGTLLPDGAFLDRHFKANEYEYYIQDSWRVTPKLTLTYGIRHTILQTPWETHGQQVAPTIDTDAWYKQREAVAQQGGVYEPDLYFAPNGPYYHKPGYWPKSKNNVAPRFAIAWAPDPKTSIRAGFGIYYDHFGESLVNNFDQNGSFGLGTVLTNPAGLFTTATSPRFTGERNIPFNNGVPPPTQTFPYAPPDGSFLITWGLNSKMKTPYSESFDTSIQRELPHGFTVEVSYVGRLGRHLLQQLDLAEPVDYVDPQGGGDYYAAGAQLTRMVDLHGDNPNAQVPAIQYFEDVFPFMKNLNYPGESATQAIYTNEWAPQRLAVGITQALADIDFYCVYGCPAGYQSKFWQNQFSSLYALSTIGMSSYNAGQVSIRHESPNGFILNASYTLSKSIDMGSDTERNTEFITNGQFGGESAIINTWKPYLNRAVSDFDTTQLFTASGVYQLPFGRGKRLAANVNGLVNAFIGGWQLAGSSRITSGLPFTLFAPDYNTDWQQPDYGIVTGKVKTHFHFDANGNPQAFDKNTAQAINSGIVNGYPIRLAYPGETGERNKFRGQGIFNIDASLAKSWSFANYGALKFTWEVYNVTNTVRFDPQTLNLSSITQSSLGVYSATLSQPRKMQFSLRYDF